MLTRVMLPTPPLRAYVHHYWVMKTERISAEMNIVPTGSMKWMFHRRTPLVVNGMVDNSNVHRCAGNTHAASTFTRRNPRTCCLSSSAPTR